MVLATGSVALPIPGVEFGDRVLDTWGAWSLPEQPKKIAVVGAGASGSEIASAYGRFGTEVLLIEMLDQILPAEDKDMVRGRRTGLQETEHRRSPPAPRSRTSRPARARSSSPTATSRPRSTTSASPAAAAPTSRASGLEEAGVELEENGKVKVDEFQRTSNPKVYAIGDLVNAKALAHKASEEGVVAVETRRRRRDPPGRPEPGRRRHLLPPAGRQRRPHRGGGQGGRPRRQGRQAEARRRRRRRPSTTTKTAWSSSSSTPSTARSSAPTSSATAPAT